SENHPLCLHPSQSLWSAPVDAEDCSAPREWCPAVGWRHCQSHSRWPYPFHRNPLPLVAISAPTPVNAYRSQAPRNKHDAIRFIGDSLSKSICARFLKCVLRQPCPCDLTLRGADQELMPTRRLAKLRSCRRFEE